MKSLFSYLLILGFISTQSVFAQFSGGDGSYNDPYLISSFEELDSIRYFLNSHFKLTQNINAGKSSTINILTDKGTWQDSTQYSKYDYVSVLVGQVSSNYYCVEVHKSDSVFNPSKWVKTNLSPNTALGFEPIGWSPNPTNNTFPTEEPFKGWFNGNGFVIDSVYIFRPEEQNVGLFGYMNNSSSSISNLGVTKADVSGAWCVGALIGTNRAGTIHFCHSSGVIKGNPSTASSGAMGGLVGRNGYSPEKTAVITYSYSSADVQGFTSSASGYYGGLTGVNNSRISSSYARGSVSGSSSVGGLSGNNYGGTINNCYATGTLLAPNPGGLVGNHQYTVNNSYWDTQSTGATFSAGGIGKSSSEMTYPYDANTFVSWNFNLIWRPDSTGAINDGYPYLCPVQQKTEQIVACNKYRWRDGVLYTTNNSSATYFMPNAADFGCDSLIELNLFIVEIDTSVRLENASSPNRRLVSNARNKSYQWFDRGTGSFDIILGATDSIFSPSVNMSGFYGVIVSDSLCSDTSRVFFITEYPPEGLAEYNSNLKLYPNPVNDFFSIESSETFPANSQIILRDALGRTIEVYELKQEEKANYELKGEKGLYFVEIKSPKWSKTLKLIKE